MERKGFKVSKRRVSSLWITNLVYVHNWPSKIIFINTFNNWHMVSKNKFLRFIDNDSANDWSTINAFKSK